MQLCLAAALVYRGGLCACALASLREPISMFKKKKGTAGETISTLSRDLLFMSVQCTVGNHTAQCVYTLGAFSLFTQQLSRLAGFATQISILFKREWQNLITVVQCAASY